MIRALYLDHSGRLWVASTRGGLGRIDKPSEAQPRFVAYTTAEGLSNNTILCLTEDQWGRIYACTGHGVDRLDPTTGRIRHYTSADGLARGEPGVASRDCQGALWFGSLLGLSSLMPELDEPASPPPVLVTGLEIRGVSQPLAELGENSISGLVLQCAKPLVGARKLCVLKGCECRVGGAGQTISCVSREGWAANRSVLASRSGVKTEFAGGKEILGVRKGAEGTLVVNRVGTGSGRPINAQPSRSHELFHVWTGRATGTRMAMRTIWPVLNWGHRNGSCPLSCRQRSR
jgi:hypothetical protein